MRRPSTALRQMQALTDRLSEAMAMQRRRGVTRASVWQPAMDLRAEEDAYVVEFDLPGVAREDIEAVAEGTLLRVRGVANGPRRIADARTIRSERSSGQFVRTVRLPSDADTTNTSATLADGVLRIRVPRRRGGGRINIQIGSE